jgi:hypothetical protein
MYLTEETRSSHSAPAGQQPLRSRLVRVTLPVDYSSRALLRHLAATLAYRAAKVLRDAPPGFAATAAGPTTRHPLQIVAHMADLMAWAQSLAVGQNVWKAGGGDDFGAEVERFFTGLAALDRSLNNTRRRQVTLNS